MLHIARMVQRTRVIPGNNMWRYSLLTPALHLHVNHRQTKQYNKTTEKVYQKHSIRNACVDNHTLRR